MPEHDEIQSSLRSLHEKLDRALALLEGGRSPARRRPTKEKPAPLTQEDIDRLQTQFASLYERWFAGQEVEVQHEIEQLDADDLRRLADANNLNVTSKMPKAKVIHLIGARFREKKQLLRPPSAREDPKL
jgi:hypothetical protein